jgi:hypothetical protein
MRVFTISLVIQHDSAKHASDEESLHFSLQGKAIQEGGAKLLKNGAP